MAFQVGYNKSLVFAGTTLKIKAWTWDDHVERLITTHSQSGGIQEWLAGILDGEGHCEALVDSANMPASLNIVPGTKGIILLQTATANFSIPMGVTKVHYASAVNGLVEYSFDFALDGATGAYTRPVT